jgi:hypothetical protein
MSDVIHSDARRNIPQSLGNNAAAIPSGSIFTAVPVDARTWRVKALAGTGETALLGTFEGRLPALGATLLLSARCGGRAVP